MKMNDNNQNQQERLEAIFRKCSGMKPRQIVEQFADEISNATSYFTVRSIMKIISQQSGVSTSGLASAYKRRKDAIEFIMIEKTPLVVAFLEANDDNGKTTHAQKIVEALKGNCRTENNPTTNEREGNAVLAFQNLVNKTKNNT